MKQNKPVKKSLFTLDRWSGIFTTLIILVLIVIALILVVLRLPVNNASPSLGATLTPIPTIVGAVVAPPPIVDTTGIVVMGGLLVLLVLGIVLRELAWFRRQP